MVHKVDVEPSTEKGTQEHGQQSYYGIWLGQPLQIHLSVWLFSFPIYKVKYLSEMITVSL